MRFGLVPVGYRGDVVVQLAVFVFCTAPPAERLDGYFQIFPERNRVEHVPAVEAPAVGKAVGLVRGKRGTRIEPRIALREPVASEEVIFRAGAARWSGTPGRRR